MSLDLALVGEIQLARLNVARFSRPEPQGDGTVIGPDVLLVEHWQTVLEELLACLS